MPRPALAKVSTAALQAEIERRVSKLVDLVKLRDDVDKQIADLKTLAGQFKQPVAAPVAEEPKPVRKYRRRKVKTAKVVAKPVMPAAKKKFQRGTFAETGEAMILRLLAKKPMTTGELAAQWKAVGRGGRVDNDLSRMVKGGTVKRAPAPAGVGSVYSVAGGKPAAKTNAKPVTKKAAVNLMAKKIFTCPTCKQVFDSGPKLGVHYQAEPTHRKK